MKAPSMKRVRAETLVRGLADAMSRRGFMGGLATVLSLAPVPVSGTDAKKRKKRKNKKKIKRNAFGCVNVGGFCENAGQCCSSICEGKKGKKSCQAHDTSTCQPGQQEAFCGGAEDVNCPTLDGAEGFCEVTTGNAPYCFGDGACFPCSKDADCVPFCGPGAACLACGGCLEENGAQTLCAAPVNSACTFPSP